MRSGWLEWGVTNNLDQRWVHCLTLLICMIGLVFAKYVKFALDEIFVVNVEQFSGFSDH